MKTPFFYKSCALWAFFALLVWTEPTFSQTSRLFTSEQGLPTSHLNRLFLDNSGYLWVTGEGGLSRFDGTNFVTYKNDLRNEFSLNVNNTNAIFQDKNGVYWVGTGKGLAKFNVEKNSFSHQQVSVVERNGLPVGISEVLMNPVRGNCLLIGTQGYGLYAFDTDTQKLDSALTQKLTQPTDPYICRLLVDSCHILWISNPARLMAFDLNKNEYLPIQTHWKNADLLDNVPVNQFVEDRENGNVYLATDKKGLILFDRTTSTFRSPIDSRLRQMEVKAVLQQADGTVLLGTENEGLWVFDRQTERISPYQVHNCPINLKQSKIHSLIEDVQGNLWLGVFQKGLLQIPLNNNGFVYYPVSDQPEGKNVACNTSIVKDNQGRLWIGTDGGGIFVVDGDKTTNINNQNSILETNSIMCMQKDREGTIWAATYGSGVYCYRNGKMQVAGGMESLQREKVMAMIYDEKRNILYIGTHGKGVYSYEIATRQLANVSLGINRWAFSLFLDSDGCLWIGTAAHISCYDTKSKQLLFQELLMPYVMVATSFAEVAGSIWMGTTGGVLELNKAHHELRHYTTQDGLPTDEVVTLFEGKKDRLWLITTNEVACMNLYNRQISSYPSYDGLRIGEFRYGSFYKSGDQEIGDEQIIVGGDNGIIYFYPDQLDREEQPVGDVYFSELFIHETPIKYNPSLGDKNFLSCSLLKLQELTLPHKNNSFSLSFSAQEYTNPMKVRYAYRLEGFDNNWYYTDQRSPRASYANLPPGNYTFELKAFLDKKQENATVRRLRITVEAPWYASWWAWTVYALAFLALISWVARYIFIRKRNKLQMLSLKQEEQIKEAKLKLFTSISHEIRTPLTLILSPLRSLIEQEKNENAKGLFELMQRNGNRILLLINQLMDVRRIDNGQLTLHFEEENLLEVLKNSMLYFSNMATVHRITFSLETMEPGAVKIWCDRMHFDKIFFNILSNAFKFTPDEGKILIRVACHDNKNLKFKDGRITEYVEVRFFNSESSIDEHDLELIFDRFYQGHNNAGKSGSGIGLNLTKQLVDLHHGQIGARNVEQNGVEFTVLLPLGNAHLSETDLLPREELAGLEEEEDLRQPQAVLPNEASLQEEAEDKGAADRKRYTILMVDDDVEFCNYVQNQLADYKVVVCNSGNAAWKQVLGNAPDVVVTDLLMPDGDGYELCNRIKSNPDTDHVPVIVLTSERTDRAEEKSTQCMADRFLSKPLNIVLLRGAIGQALRVRENILNKMHRTEMGYDYDQVKVDSTDIKLLKKVTETIRGHLSDPEFSVEELSKEVGISRVHLNRKLKDGVGMSPSVLLKTIRLKQAAYLLANNKVNISEVSYMVGFSNPSYFSNTFSNYFGMTPKEFVFNYMENPDKMQLKTLLGDTFQFDD